MKCAKSRNSKNLRSASGSLGTVPGWRSASSETIRGDADPTWWTWSSGLGSPAMKPAREESAGVTHRSLSLELLDQVVGEVLDRATVLEDRTVEQHRRRALHPGVRGRLGRLHHPGVALVALDRAADVGLGRPGLDGQVRELGALREGTGLAGLVLEEQVVELLRDRGAGLVEHDRERAGGPDGVARGVATAEQVERAVLHLDLAVGRQLGEVVAGGLLELTAERAEEVLVDDDLVGRAVRADRDAELARRARRVRGDVLGRVEVAGDQPAREQHHDDADDDAADHQVAAAALLALLRLQCGRCPSGTVVGAVLLRHHGPSITGVRRNRTLSSASLLCGSQARKSEAASSAASRAISQGYCDAASGLAPPPPKQPQSMLMPRAQTDAIPAMNTTKSTAEATAAARVRRPR